MKSFFNVVVVIPIGPKCLDENIEDTIQSFVNNCRSDYRIVLADDSQRGTGERIQQIFPLIDVVSMPTSMGKLCGLYVTLALAFRHVLSKYRFEALLRLDTDALIIGRDPEKEAIQFFKNNPRVGMAGQYPYDYSGKPWDISWPREQIIKYTGTYKFFKKPLAHFILWNRYRKARKNGYKPGESVFGGACFFSEPCLIKLHQSGLLPNHNLKSIILEEDHLFSLLVKSVGFELGNLASGKGSIGCAWLGLPASPEELHQSGKKIIHSTRYWKEMNEKEIRTYFRNKRKQLTGIAPRNITTL